MMRNRNYRSHLSNTWPFILVNGFFCVVLSMFWIDLASNDFVHPLYNGTSIFFVFLASLVVLAMAAQRSLVLQILSLLLTGFYTQRVIVTYYAPENFDYNDYVNFTIQNIQSAAQFYFLCVLFILVGAVIFYPFLTGLFCRRRHAVSADSPNIRYFAFRVNFQKLCRTALWLTIVAYFYKFLLVAKGFGLTGNTYESGETVLMWSLGIADALSPFVLFSWVYFPDSSREKKLAGAALVFVILNGLVMTSKGFLLGMMASYYLILRLAGRKVPMMFYVYAAVFLVFSIFIFFPAMTVLRSSLLSDILTFSFDEYGELLANAFLSFSRRLGGFDWMTLWLTVSRSEIPPNATTLGELIGLINKLIPGELVAQPDAVSLAKLQNLLGRGWGELSVLGGHGENQGGLATVYIYFGKTIALIYFAIWGVALAALEKARIHLFHKVAFLSSYLIVFMIGGGFVLMHGALFWYLVFTTSIVVMLMLVELLKRGGRRTKDGRTRIDRAFLDPEHRSTAL